MAEIMDTEGIETLKTRRVRACLAFASRAVNTRFGLKWLPRNPTTRDARTTTRREFQEVQPRTERDRNNPIQNIIRLLNLQSSN